MDSTSVDVWIEAENGTRLAGRRWACEQPRGGIGILHGLGDHSGRFEKAARTLVARGFTVEALDLPGHGRTPGQRGHIGSWPEYREAVTAWLDACRLARPGLSWALFGQSMGALIALDWHFANPSALRALVLSAPPFELALRPSLLKVYAAQLVARLWPRFAQETSIAPSMLSHDPEVVWAHRKDPLVHYRISARLFLELQAARRSLAGSARAVDVPTLVIQGGGDPVTRAAGTARWASRAAPGRVVYREFPGLYHEVLNESVGPAVLEEIATWLGTVLADGAPSGSRREVSS